jgi:hypothetical protein
VLSLLWDDFVPNIVIKMNISKLILDFCKSAKPEPKKTAEEKQFYSDWQGRKHMNRNLFWCYGHWLFTGTVLRYATKGQKKTAAWCLGDFHLEASRSIVLQVCMCSVLVWIAYFLFGCSALLLLTVIDPTANSLVGNTTTRLREGEGDHRPHH